MKSNKNILTYIIKVMRKKRREEELFNYGKSISYPLIYKSKKQYNRKNKHKDIFE